MSLFLQLLHDTKWFGRHPKYFGSLKLTAAAVRYIYPAPQRLSRGLQQGRGSGFQTLSDCFQNKQGFRRQYNPCCPLKNGQKILHCFTLFFLKTQYYLRRLQVLSEHFFFSYLIFATVGNGVSPS